ncbi:methyltransferase domain-containing protein [Streptomyces sp. P1-3]|uniref:methyltransferase domain-containing protein n=1 Tax=Streptomyces sp. P1-3 TaxID=3421658 RepID=UPI003D367238
MLGPVQWGHRTVTADHEGIPSPREGGPAGDIAVDLGCWPGPQSLALARLGFGPISAVDTSETLLTELARHGDQNPAIRPIRADIRDALPQVADPGTVGAVVCMGDTLPHLQEKSDVVAYRDLTRPLIGTDRFLPVRTAHDRLLTCFLEYLDDDTVMVHDLLHTRSDGTWTLQASSYPKLRIGSGWLVSRCRGAGVDIQHDANGPRGMRFLHARKP